MSRAQEQPRAVVVGAGIGGLSTAVGLVRIGWRVTVLERAPELREAGAGISLLANALRSLDQLGVGEVVRSRSATMMPGGEGVRIPSGRRLMKPADPEFVRDHGLSVTVLPRPELHRALREALPPGCVRTGAEVTGIAQLPEGGAVLSYRDADSAAERTVRADVVVAADGKNSRSRRSLFPDAPEPVYSGHSVWRGIAEVSRAEEPGGTTWGNGLEFGRMPLVDGRGYWYAVTNAEAGTRRGDDHAEVLRRFGSWHAPIPELLRATPPEAVLYHDVFEFAEPLPSYVASSTALLGDAAHAMTTDLGQGACQAIEDAVVLCAALAVEKDVSAALASYDEQRRPRTRMIIEASRRIGRLKLREGKLGVLVRNAIMAATPPRAGERAMARIGDWYPPTLPGRVPA
ncbi:FAD-dependent monooxygenase [Amycolatopsis japonica]|uniref:FAD-dependent monooxygenase n=1 Tax=Amycolatopsis japonica TaxID=208439 RepID=UPI0033206CB0